jgi:hypothetical protein
MQPSPPQVSGKELLKLIAPPPFARSRCIEDFLFEKKPSPCHSDAQRRNPYGAEAR